MSIKNVILIYAAICLLVTIVRRPDLILYTSIYIMTLFILAEVFSNWSEIKSEYLEFKSWIKRR